MVFEKIKKELTGDKGAKNIVEVVTMIFVLAFLIGGLWFVYFIFFNGDGLPRYYGEGTVRYDNCNQIIKVRDDDYLQKYLHRYICNIYRTKSGTVMGGECVRIEKDDSYPVRQCARAYVFELPPPSNCQDNVKDGIAYPYLGYDDMCYTTPQEGEVYINQ